jgi:hypothetical protein
MVHVPRYGCSRTVRFCSYSRPDLEIVLKGCKLTSAGTSALVEVLGRNQGPSKLELCEIDNSVVANGLHGNSRLNYWRPRPGSPEDGNRDVLAIADALLENKGLVHLDLMHEFMMSDETWHAVCDSLKTHPTIEVLDLRGATSAVTTMAPAVLKSRIQALVDMLKVNKSIHTINLSRLFREHGLFRGSIVPPRLRAIQKTLPITYRAKVLYELFLQFVLT